MRMEAMIGDRRARRNSETRADSPAIPHYRLRKLHELLKDDHPTYGRLVVETHGTFHDSEGRRTILDEMTRPREVSVAGG